MLDSIQRGAFGYFLHETNAANGLVPTTSPDWPASIAAVGLGLAAYPVGVERGFVTRTEAAKRTLATLRFFWGSRQGPEPDATGHKGFYYHFLDLQSGARAWQSELSTVDSALLLGGMLTSAEYFDGNTPAEREIRDLAERLYARVDWQWAQNGGLTVTHGWKPESGFLPYRWEGYDEALLLYLLGLGSPTHPLPRRATEPGPRPMSGRPSTTSSTSCSSNTPSAIPVALRITGNCAGGSPRATGRAASPARSMVSSGGSSTISRGRCHTVPTTARSLPGRWSPRCRLRRRSCCRRSPISRAITAPVTIGRLQGNVQSDVP